jgi:uncharacterized membrane protein YhaH (DUF805 family)
MQETPPQVMETRLKERVELFYFSLFTVLLAVSALMLFFLAYTQRSIFSAIDPAMFVVPFLCYTFCLLCSCLAMTLMPLHMRTSGNKAGLSPSRLWLYLAASFGSLSVILFLVATSSVLLLILL